tara:strand:- start:252 stop:389 length:138 start_codon:yes stop_codon:yes gene_type:complete
LEKRRGVVLYFHKKDEFVEKSLAKKISINSTTNKNKKTAKTATKP